MGHTKIVELLVQCNSDLTVATKNGWTVLMLAALNEHTKIVELLVKNSVDLSVKDKDGKTALELAVDLVNSSEYIKDKLQFYDYIRDGKEDRVINLLKDRSNFGLLDGFGLDVTNMIALK